MCNRNSRPVFERAVAACYRAIDFRKRGRYLNTVNVKIIRWYHSENVLKGWVGLTEEISEEFVLSQT
jgi:hypothetical protein